MKHYQGFTNTSPLWTKEQFGLKQFEFLDITLANFKPQPIPTNLRLGHQVEYIFKHLLDHSTRYNVLAHNIQLKRGKETIGELDFIIEDFSTEQIENTLNERTKRYIHIELTYKFYLIDPTISEPIHRLMGPNRRDMFFTKMEKTRDKQMPMLFSKEGREALARHDINPDAVQQQTYFLAQLFTPYLRDSIAIRPLNKECIVGFWTDFVTFNSSPFKTFMYYIPYKYEWLHTPHNGVEWQSHFDTLLDINVRHIKNQAPMLWIKKADSTFEKCFVVWW